MRRAVRCTLPRTTCCTALCERWCWTCARRKVRSSLVPWHALRVSASRCALPLAGIPTVLEPPSLQHLHEWDGVFISSTSRLVHPLTEVVVPPDTLARLRPSDADKLRRNSTHVADRDGAADNGATDCGDGTAGGRTAASNVAVAFPKRGAQTTLQRIVDRVAAAIAGRSTRVA